MLRAKLGENIEHNIPLDKLVDCVLLYFEIYFKFLPVLEETII